MRAAGQLSFTRHNVQKCVQKRIDALGKGYRQNMGLLGPEGHGKTQLLSQIHHHFKTTPNLLTVYVHAEALSFDHFVEKWFGGVLASLFLNANEVPADRFQDLIQDAESRIPVTVSKIKEIKKMMRKGERHSHTIRQLFSITKEIADETGKKVLLIVDEFHKLESLPTSDPFAVLGKEIMVQKETLYLVASSKPEKAKSIFHDKLSLLFGNFEIIEMKPLNYSEICQFVESKYPELCFNDTSIRFLIQLTGGLPVYLDIILYNLYGSVITKRSMSHESLDGQKGIPVHTEELVESVCNELFDSNGRISLKFERKLTSLKRYAKEISAYIQTLMAVSSGRRKVSNIAAYTEMKSGEIKKILERLIQEEIVVKRGSFYLIEDVMLRFWLIEVCRRKGLCYGPESEELKNELKICLKRLYDQVEIDAKVDVTARLGQLFKEFRNDYVEINQKKWKCPQFSEIVFKPSNGRLFPLYARGSRVRWICQVASEPVQEEDVSMCLEEFKRYRKNTQRKIIIALAGIEQNAKLMAQEAKIQLWDVNGFNSLLDLYNLPKIILKKEFCEANVGLPDEGAYSA